MSSHKCVLVLLLACCLSAFVTAYVVPESEEVSPIVEILRQKRSPQHGSVVVTANKDQQGRQASVQYNHNLYTSKDGRGSVDAYANANRNFDYNRNDVSGGIQGKWSF